MTRMSWKGTFGIKMLLVVLVSTGGWAQEGSSSKYPQPRFLSDVKAPQSWKDVVPYARTLYQSKVGFAGYGLGMLFPTALPSCAAIVFPVSSDPMIIRAIVRANIEHHEYATFLRDYELVGVSEQDAEALEKFNHFYTAEKGFMEVRHWIESWPDPKVPQNWLKSTRPDLYTLLYPPDHVLPENLAAAREKLTTDNVGKALQGYLPSHPEVDAGVFWGSGEDWIDPRRALGPLASNWLGPALWDDHWMVMNGAGSYPDDVWQLSEEITIKSIADVDRIEITDPEGTNLTAEIPEEMAKRWAEGAYERGHIMLFPNMATGRFARTMADYPASTLGGEWIPRAPMALANGVVAGTVGPDGFFPRMEVHFKDGYVSEVVGGGTYGDLLRTFLKYPKIDSIQFPYHDRPGWFYLYEVVMGTHPKWLRDPDLMMVGDLTPERMRSGVLHFGLGLGLENDDPSAAGKSPTWQAFTAKNNLPADHGFHVNNYFATYRVHLRSSDKWVTLIDRGHMTSLDDPEVRALASRYGDPDKILAEDWIPEVAGINAPGQYEDYARDPWKYTKAVMDQVVSGTYQHYYPPRN